MKNYYLILIENFIGIGYLILFLFGFFTNNLNLYHIGGIGMIIFMLIIIKGQPKNLTSFLIICGIGSIVAYFVSNWWVGLFWASAFFSVGQVFGIIALIRNREFIIKEVENQKIKTKDLVKFAVTGKAPDPDKLSIIEVLLFFSLIIIPYLLIIYFN
ncbi:hypothetical protein [Aequorivita sp. KMM 9714]|uniref:hypothetical protein n=1 Tax=Aequorivita sp. KMM 9714 TaxID=2707173 RepID=UPI0013EA9678|nr:hypothetical protein [Aequorivita sp. KMM 9714]NGX84874.1 hypothetical protein [Aequorivita sp. KMM 9714]